MRTTELGDVNKYPSINSIVGIINERGTKNERKLVLSTMNEYYSTISKLSVHDDSTRVYLLRLVKLDYLKRLEDSYMGNLLKSHMRCLLTSIHNDQVRKLKLYKKQYVKK